LINLRDLSGQAPLGLAVGRAWYYASVDVLLERADININQPGRYGVTPFIQSIVSINMECFRDLLARSDIDINDRGECYCTPISVALQMSEHKFKLKSQRRMMNFELIISSLLEMEALDVNRQDGDGSTPLMRAVRRPWAFYSLLKRSDIDVNIKNIDGNTVLALVAKARGFESSYFLQRLLEKNDIDVNLKNNEGKTALALAIENGLRRKSTTFERARRR
jgi:ankyrin repeat protein